MQKTVKPIRTGEEYIESLKGRDLKIYLFGELVKEPVSHPMIDLQLMQEQKHTILQLKKKNLHSLNLQSLAKE